MMLEAVKRPPSSTPWYNMHDQKTRGKGTFSQEGMWRLSKGVKNIFEEKGTFEKFVFHVKTVQFY